MGTARLLRSVFAVPRMDCPSEESLIRMALQDLPGGARLAFDLAGRRLTAVHEAPVAALLERLGPLGLGAALVDSVATEAPDAPTAQMSQMAQTDRSADRAEARTLRLLLAINGVMFAVELVLGWLAESAGLVADSLDMFADAAVYGLALYAVGRAAAMKTRAAHLAGWLQALLALGALAEVVRRFFFGSEPESGLMMGVALLALAANVTCLVLVARQRDRGAHMKASHIFAANDVVANLGVVAAGALVGWTGSHLPDLAIGCVIAAVVLHGAWRILRLR